MLSWQKHKIAGYILYFDEPFEIFLLKTTISVVSYPILTVCLIKSDNQISPVSSGFPSTIDIPSVINY